ncbi:hypothetical protein ACEWY4_018481 [Coilia grayii]|uniref:Ion transport domain-containing protein n=1 Tax=Coilia grayii TaxID=363190 RepID=A0ABD1JGE3_9TELE
MSKMQKVMDFSVAAVCSSDSTGTRKRFPMSRESSFYKCVIDTDDATLDSDRVFEWSHRGTVACLGNLIRKHPECLTAKDDAGATALHHATSGRSLEAIRLLASATGPEGLNVCDYQGSTPLHWAVERQAEDSCALLLELGADPNILNAALMSPLHLAISKGHNSMVELLLSFRDTDANLEGELGNTPVMLACSSNNCHALHILFKYGARLCSQNKLGHYAIHAVAFAGAKEAMEVILKKGEETGHSLDTHVNYLDKYHCSPLHLAVRGGNIEVIKLCIEKGARVHQQQADRSTALHLACTQGAIEAVKLMLCANLHGDDIINMRDGANQTPLHRATIFDHVDLAEYLISKGADIDCIDCKGLSPLLLATSCGAWRAVAFLLSKGANVNIKDKEGRNFLHLATFQPKGLKNIPEDILQMTAVRELLCGEDNEGCTPLHYACRLGIHDSVKNILGLQICPKRKSNNKKSAFHFAAEFGRVNTCHRLLETITDSQMLNEGDEHGLTPLHLASRGGHTKVVDLLLRKGALFQSDYKGMTCLHHAAAEGYTQTMQILLAANIKLLDKVDEDGNTALHLAAREGHVAAVTLLLERNAAFLLNKSEVSFFHEAVHNGRKDVANAIIENERCGEAIRCFKPQTDVRCVVIDLIELLPESYKHLLDQCIIESDHDANSPDYNIQYNFQFLQAPIKLKKHTVTDKSLKVQPLAGMNAMVQYNRIELLTHPVCNKYLEMKWLAYGSKVHLLNLVIYLLGLLPLTFLIVNLRPTPTAGHNGTSVVVGPIPVHQVTPARIHVRSPHTIPPHTTPPHTIPPHTTPPHTTPPHTTPPHTIPPHTTPPHTTPPHTTPPHTTPPHTIPPHTIPPHTTPPHTTPPHTIPPHTTPPHTIPPPRPTPSHHTPPRPTPPRPTPSHHTPPRPTPSHHTPSHPTPSHHPAPHHPTAHHPTAHHPTTHHPTAHHPAAHHPTTHHPAPHHPAPHHPTAHHPTTHHPAPHHPTTPPHTIPPHTIPPHTTPPHTIPPHTTPPHTTPPHTILPPRPTPSHHTPSHHTPSRRTPPRPTPSHHTPPRPTPSHHTPPRPTPPHRTPSHRTPPRPTPPRPTPSHHIPSHHTPPRPTPPHRTPSHHTPPRPTPSHHPAPHHPTTHHPAPHHPAPHHPTTHHPAPHHPTTHHPATHHPAPHHPTTPPHTTPPHTTPPHTIPPHTTPPHTTPPHTIPPHTTPPHTIPPHTIPPHTIPPHTTPPHTIPPHTIPPHTIPPHTIPPHTTPPHTIPPHTIPPHTIPPHTTPPHTTPPHTIPPPRPTPSHHTPPRPTPSHPLHSLIKRAQSASLLCRNGYLVTSAMIMVLVMSSYAILKQMAHASQQKMKYFKDPSNPAEWATSIATLVFIIPMLFGVNDKWVWEAGALAILLAWINFLLYLQRFEHFGIYVVMFGEIIKTLLSVIVLVIFLVLAFGLSFYALMLHQSEFQWLSLSLAQTFVMMVGELNYQSNFFAAFESKRLAFPEMTYVVFVFFILLMPILLMNLMIGLAVGDIAEVQRNACLKRIAMQIDLHTNLEEKLPYWLLKRVDKPTITVYPNRACRKRSVFKFWDSGDASVARSRLNTGSQELTPLETELRKQKLRLREMSSVLEKQHSMVKLILQKMEITSEADDYDGPVDAFRRRRGAAHRSKWIPLVRSLRPPQRS